MPHAQMFDEIRGDREKAFDAGLTGIAGGTYCTRLGTRFLYLQHTEILTGINILSIYTPTYSFNIAKISKDIWQLRIPFQRILCISFAQSLQ